MTAPELDRLVERVAPGVSDRVRLELGGTGFSYEALGGRLTVTGQDRVAAAAGLHHYSIHHAGQRATWAQPRLHLPDPLPDAPATSATTELEVRYYLNFVTHGYTMAFWDWGRWEREIDWMALHGINRPLVTIGHETILVETYLAMGLSEDEALGWLGSAAHFPWMFMGCLNSWGGPVSRQYLDGRLALAQRVLERMRQLGMRPVLPGFGGQVPSQLAGGTEATVGWQGWETPYLDPTTGTYRDIASRFYAIQTEHLGTDHLYAIDPFIESVPPDGDPGWLRSAAAGIHGTLAQHDSEAVWVIQGWPFHYHRSYWTMERIEAFISGVPDDQLLLLDLWAEFMPIWQRTDAMFGRPWLWCAVHNYGGRFALFGDLRTTIDSVEQARNSPSRGRLVGLGLAMEAIENNEVFYELLLDQVWGHTPLEEWLRRWAHTRYQTNDPKAEQVWRILAATLYGPGRARSTPSPVIARPWSERAPFASQRLAGEALTDEPEHISANIDAENDPAVFAALPSLALACELLLQLPTSPHRDRDLRDVLTHVLAQHARYPIRAILRAHAEDPIGIAPAMDYLAEHIMWLDRLAATHPETLVGTWLGSARQRATNAEEADRFDHDARSLVTVWGRQDSGLHDYSGRHWAGLLRDFYLPRWRIWAEWLEAGVGDVDDLHRRIIKHEEAWRTDHTPYPTTPEQSTAVVARHILDWLADDLPPLPPERRNL